MFHSGVWPSLLVGGALALLLWPSPPELKANGSLGTDSDGDGLIDLQEAVLGSEVDQVDSDLDGFSDLEEIARQSDPLDPAGMPIEQIPSTGMVARVNNQVLTFLTAVYVPDGQLAKVGLQFGLVINGITAPIATSIYLSASVVRLIPGGISGSRIVLIETSLPEAWVHSVGGASFYTVVDQVGYSKSAASMSLFSSIGIDSQGQPLPALVRAEPAPASLQTGPGPQTTQGGGFILRALNADERTPVDWVPGEVCYQEMQVVGANGVNVVYEITSSSCEALDSFCSPTNCAAALGQEIEIVDPGVIAGG